MMSKLTWRAISYPLGYKCCTTYIRRGASNLSPSVFGVTKRHWAICVVTCWINEWWGMQSKELDHTSSPRVAATKIVEPHRNNVCMTRYWSASDSGKSIKCETLRRDQRDIGARTATRTAGTIVDKRHFDKGTMFAIEKTLSSLEICNDTSQWTPNHIITIALPEDVWTLDERRLMIN